MTREEKKEEVIELFKSGDFTIVYWDSDDPTIYKGKWNYDEEDEKDECREMFESQIDVSMYNMNGYAPDVVAWLVEALGGKVDSI